jgi:perosamine synthetase
MQQDSHPLPKLAINGGQPAYQGPIPPWPRRNPATDAVLLAAIEEGFWGKYHSDHSQTLKKRICQFHQIEQILLCCSGTIAVELGLRGLGVGDGDEVILAGYDFPGNFRAIEAVGATPVLVDIDPQTWSIDVDQIKTAISTETKAVVASHLHGGLVDMTRLRTLADDSGLLVLEDACQSPGAMLNGRPVGSFGDVSVLSFGGSKPLTAGRGGALLSREEKYIQRAKIFGERGNDAFPLSEIQAALLLPQYDLLAERVAIRHESAVQIQATVNRLDQLECVQWASYQPSFFKIGLLLKPAIEDPNIREDFIRAIQAEGIQLDAGFRGFTKRSGRRCRKAEPLTNAENASLATLVLHHPVLLESHERIAEVCEALEKVYHHLIGPS